MVSPNGKFVHIVVFMLAIPTRTQAASHLSGILLQKLVSAQYHIVFDEGFQTVSLLRSTLNHAAVWSTFSTLLKDTEWLHSDAFADTSQTDTQNYYFDTNWDLSSWPHNSTRSNGCQTVHTCHASCLEHDSANPPQNIPPTSLPVSKGDQA